MAPRFRAGRRSKLAMVALAPKTAFVQPETRRAIVRELVKDAGFKAGVAFAEALLVNTRANGTNGTHNQ